MVASLETTQAIDLPVLLNAMSALKRGDFSVRLPHDWTGAAGKVADAFNEVIELNERMARELERLGRVVGKEGKLTQRASLGDVRGSWAASIDSVNDLIGDLVRPTRETARVIGAVAQGDLSQTMALELDDRPLQGEFLGTAKTINKMVDQLSSFASEVTRVAREVGTEGELGGQAQVKNVAGTWKDLTDSVNSMAGNLTGQVRNIAEVTTAVANGDLSKKITVDVKGEFLELKNTINTMVDQLRSFASEVTRVAREVGTEGQLGGQAKVEGVSGTWKDLTDSVNSMASNLTGQVRNIANVTTAVAKGDLSKKITVDVKGEFGELSNTINTMVDQLSSFASEVTRVAREVGTEGQLGGQAKVEGVSGTWKDLTDSVNSMAGNLTGQVRNIAAVTTAVANGDLSKKITVDVKGEILELKNTINTMVDQLSSFAAEVTRVAREVGTEGKLGGQAKVEGVSGTWKDLTDSVNSMAGNLTGQVRNIAAVTTAVANGDLSKKITVDVKGEILELKNTINTMVDQLSSFASEVTRVAREVGSEGKLGGQAQVRGVAGTWKDLTDSVNGMAGNLTAQVRNIAEVTTAVANGDLSKKITVDVKGEFLELKNTINTMVDQLRSFASEVTRVAREVGTEGKLGGQAQVEGVSGTWKDLTDSVNSMAGNLTGQVRNIAAVTTAVANGDLSKKITVDVKGEILELKNTINTMVDQLRSFASEVTRVAREVGTEGQLGGQAKVEGVSGTWKDLTDSVNFMASNLTGQVRNIAAVTTAVATGDLSKKITVDVKGEFLELSNTINTMVDQLGSFAAEVTRVAREVGTEGKLGGQAQVKGVSGTWKDLTDNVNSMAGNLTSQVRGIAKVVTAVANGDLKQKLTVEAKGEIAALADTINSMIETLATFADQVTTVAREVGVEGKLGGQAKVPGAAGTWKMLTENVNQLAANLTTQVRAIAEVATAVTKGDLTRSITVEALGEVAALKDNINEMIRNLKDTTLKNSEQDWLKTNLAKFSRMLQGQRDLTTVGRMILSELVPVVGAQQAVFYVHETVDDQPQLTLLASYADQGQDALGKRIGIGEGLTGQCALEKQKILVTNCPPNYFHVSSALGVAAPKSIIVLPVIFEGELKGVLELASFERFNPTHQAFLDQLTESIGIVLNTIEANMRTEGLLKQSQSLAQELQSRQEELQNTNQELEEKAGLLAHQNQEVERKNREVEQARQALEEKAKQLALTSKYKSEFLANMSHELRTPLNSLLILSDQLSKNAENNLTSRQMEFAKTIHSSGNDLLMLINDILDLSKIESGTVMVDVGELRLSDLNSYVERTFRHVAEAKEVEFSIELDPQLPKTMLTDAKRLQQVIKNLLSNAFKFTHQGRVKLTVKPIAAGWNTENDLLNHASGVLAFVVTDTGIGISPDKQQIIFEAFQQADGSTSRKYGGTGLGLAISRELSRLLGGEIRLTSIPGKGSTFTLFLPQAFVPQKLSRKASTERVSDDSLTHIPANLVAPPREQPTELLEPEVSQLVNEVGDDRNTIQPDDVVMLIVENDLNFARILLQAAHERGFKGLVTSMGAAALTMAREYRPTAMTLDICLPDINGWRVLERLKNDANIRHIPVWIVSTEEIREQALSSGAVEFLPKPIRTQDDLNKFMDTASEFTRQRTRNILLVEREATAQNEVRPLIEQDDLRVQHVTSNRQALAALKAGEYDCLILSAQVCDVSLSEIAAEIARTPALARLPIIYRTDVVPSADNQVALRELGRSRIVRAAFSAELLLDQVAATLHYPLAKLAPDKREVLRNLHDSDGVLEGRKVLIVDDDIRNIFALSSVLEWRNMQIYSAETGRDAIQVLQNHADIDIVLMDIMMPEMDGYETMRAIRQIPHLKNLPIIAVTAKAMKGDREKCIEAGAWDYLAKPVDSEQMLAVMRAWLRRRETAGQEIEARAAT
ncbi:Sensory/regulatory protein RpfC [Anatilimnocola aggregata]|uniref:histidine kinase n=1 Tax=Anatilimnocola aggregata TaxID=2528021 RepID=A0A517YEV3_9BACT|nr:HAMP domain-containing protein [Anatilimnocola aggregata]QDU28757.1 Sensory/regulatory protein RpfC [Anatilimnocola aggregata]